MERSRKSNASTSGGAKLNKSGSSKSSGVASTSNVSDGLLNKSKQSDSTSSSQCARDLGLDCLSQELEFSK